MLNTVCAIIKIKTDGRTVKAKLLIFIVVLMGLVEIQQDTWEGGGKRKLKTIAEALCPAKQKGSGWIVRSKNG